MGQITFSIVFLFAFRERECCPAFRAGDFKVWHDAFLHQAGLEVVLPRLLSERWAQALLMSRPETVLWAEVYSQQRLSSNISLEMK